MFRSFSTKQAGIPALLLFVSLVILFFSGCRTGPEYVVKDYASLVFHEGALFVSCDMLQDRNIVEAFLAKNKEAQDYSKLIQRTHRVSFSLTNTIPFGYDAVAQGTYPAFWVNTLLGCNKLWEKHSGPFTWWENKENHLKISVPVPDLAIISTQTVDPLLVKLKNGEREYLPDRVKKEIAQNAVVLYALHPSSKIFSTFGMKSTEITLKELDISLLPEQSIATESPQSYRIWGYLRFNNEKDARLFNTGLKLGLLTMAIREGNGAIKKLIQENPFVLQNQQIIFNGVHITLSEILDLTREKK